MDDLQLGYLRYEWLRGLTPRQFTNLWWQATHGPLVFDALVDAYRTGARPQSDLQFQHQQS